MRDRAHYLRMLNDNPNATIGVTLAAKMVAAGRNGDIDHLGDVGVVRLVTRALKQKYGETLTPDEVRREMGEV